MVCAAGKFHLCSSAGCWRRIRSVLLMRQPMSVGEETLVKGSSSDMEICTCETFVVRQPKAVRCTYLTSKLQPRRQAPHPGGRMHTRSLGPQDDIHDIRGASCKETLSKSGRYQDGQSEGTSRTETNGRAHLRCYSQTLPVVGTVPRALQYKAFLASSQAVRRRDCERRLSRTLPMLTPAETESETIYERVALRAPANHRWLN